MFGSVVRNFKNAGVRVNVALRVQQTDGKEQFPALFVHGGTGLEIHNLASVAHRELLRQARSSVLPRPRGERFEDVAWRVAAHSLFEAVPSLRMKPAAQVGMVIPYTCFIAEYLSRSYRDGEERDVCISTAKQVFINSIAGLHTESKTLGAYGT